jgi:preprotein translocase YajC subunit
MKEAGMSLIAAQINGFVLSGSGGAQSGGFNWLSLGFIVLIFVVMYFLMIRPQRKREKAVNTMRDALKIGDKVITIGGLRGEIVKVRDDVLTIQVGADKVKFEIMRWAISKVDESGSAKSASKSSKPEEEENKPVKKPRKLTPRQEGSADEAAENADGTENQAKTSASMEDREKELQSKVKKGEKDGE